MCTYIYVENEALDDQILSHCIPRIILQVHPSISVERGALELHYVCNSLFFSVEYGLWISSRSYRKELIMSSENDSRKILISSHLFISD